MKIFFHFLFKVVEGVISFIVTTLRYIYNLTPIDKFTAILVILGVFQYIAYVESERAYLLITKDVNFSDDSLSLHEKTNYVITVKNIGKHPASISTFKAKALLLVHDKVFPAVPDYGDSLIKAVSAIPPDKELSVQLNMSSSFDVFNISAEAIKGINSGDIPLFIYGVIEYNLGYWLPFRKGITGFCFKYLPVNSRPNPELKFAICDNQNYTYAN